MTTRICILGTPRSGSQYLSNVLEKSFRSSGLDICNLSEPFTFNKTKEDMFPALSSTRQIYNRVGSTPQFNSYEEQANYLLTILRLATPTQSLILKYFMDERGNLTYIIDNLKRCGFKIILLDRTNVEHHLISWGAGCLTKVWDSSFPNYVSDLQMNFNQTILSEMQMFYENFILKFRNLDIDAPVIRYEYLVEDLEKLFDIPINTDIVLKKQLNEDPYTQIVNADEVRKFIKRLIK